MDTEPARIYSREWKINKPYLPKSTSLPLLRLVPEDKVIFICKRCGFSNFLVPMCLWCCWSSAEARRDFEARATKTLRRAARSAPRLFNRPVLSAGSHKGRDVGKHIYHRLTTAPAPHPCGFVAVTSVCAMVTSAPRVLRRTPWASNHDRGNRERKATSGRRRTERTLDQRNQGPHTDCGNDNCGTGSAENNCGPTIIRHSPLRPSFLLPNHPRAGYHHRTKDATGGSSHSPSIDCAHCPPDGTFSLERPQSLLFKQPPLSSRFFSAHGPFASILPSKRRGRGKIPVTPDIIRSHYKAFKFTTSPIRAMPEDASTTDTPCDAHNALYPLSMTPHRRSLARHEIFSTQLDRRICESREAVAADTDVSTVIQYNQTPISNLNQDEATASMMQPIGPGIEITTDSPTMKTYENRVPIPSALLHQDEAGKDVLIASEERVSTTAAMNETTKKDPPPSPARTLRRKKRLSHIGLSGANNSGLAPPERSPPLSPPPLENSCSHLPSPSALPVAPPGSPNVACLASEIFSPSIVISTPTSITPIMIEPSRPIPSPAKTPLQTLPRIGTPKRPYYSTVRANMNNRANSSVSHPSATSAPSSPSSFSSAVDGSFQSPAFDGAPRVPDQSTHLDAQIVQSPTSMLADSTRAEEDDTSDAGKTHQPISPISTIPLSPVMATDPAPSPVPVQMRERPSSPVKSVLSALDPTYSDEEDEDGKDAGHHQFGVSSARFGRVLRKRKSSGLKGKDAIRENGDGYRFPLSLPLSLGRSRGRTIGTISSKLDRENRFALTKPALSPSRSYNGFHGFGIITGSGCSMSGEMEMRMALAERNLDGDDCSNNGLEPAFKFHEGPRPSNDGDHLVRSKNTGSRLMKIRSSIGLSSTSLTTSPPPSPSKPKIGSKLRGMGAFFFGKFSGGDANCS